MTRRARWLTSAALVAVLLSGSACSQSKVPVEDLGGRALGELLAEPVTFQNLPALDALVSKAVRIRYRSTSGVDGKPTEVSGVVMVPTGDPPPGGWPIASLGHPTTGIHNECAPSLSATMSGVTTTVAPFLTNGFVVAVTDYQGLGSPGPHPYLEPKTAGYNVIDAVRAARAVVPTASDTWVGFGESQGGQAVWAANELAGEYGAGLRLAGTVSLAPAADLRPFVDGMEKGTLTTEQVVLLPLMLKGVQVVHPDLNMDDYLHGDLSRFTDVFLTCAGAQEDLKGSIAKRASPADYRPVNAEAAEKLRRWFGEMSLPMRRANSPMAVFYGDADPIIPPAWTAESVRRGCALGSVIQATLLPGQGHELNIGSAGADWIFARLANQPAPSTCAVPAG